MIFIRSFNDWFKIFIYLSNKRDISIRVRNLKPAVAAVLGWWFSSLTAQGRLLRFANFAKLKSEARDRTLARTGPTAGFKLRTRIRHSTQNKLIFKGETNYERNRHGY